MQIISREFAYVECVHQSNNLTTKSHIKMRMVDNDDYNHDDNNDYNKNIDVLIIMITLLWRDLFTKTSESGCKWLQSN